MTRSGRRIIQLFAILFLVAGITGCDTFEVFDREKEISGTVEAVTDNSLTVDGVGYQVTGETEFEGDISSLDDVIVGDEVEIEYEESGGSRIALEIERGDEEDDDDGLFGKNSS